MNADEIISVRWDGATFELYRDTDEGWSCNCVRNGVELYRSSGPEAPVILTEAMQAAGFGEKTRQEVHHELMRALRERLFN
jgi:hypothetical protein